MKWRQQQTNPGLLVMALQGIRTIGHADFWTHLATGRRMAQHGIPREDPLTLASEGVAWVHSSWLYDRLCFIFPALFSSSFPWYMVTPHLPNPVRAWFDP